MYKDQPALTLEEKLSMLQEKEERMVLTVGKPIKNPNIFARGDQYLMTDLFFNDTLINFPNKMTTQPPGPTTSGYDFVSKKQFTGINFATQDYMSLCYNPGSMQATIDAIKHYGTHSGGSPLFFGKHPYYLGVLESLRKFFSPIYSDPSPSIFSVGWLAGFGVLQSLAGKKDFIIMDELCHNCLQLGAKASGSNVHAVPHMDEDAMIAKLVEIRSKDPMAGIVLVTEGLFSMDSDCADLKRLQQETLKNNAVLVVDCAHDMFCIGAKGLGNPGEKIKDFSNVILLGSGSKSLSNNFGWCVSNSKSLPQYMAVFAGPMTFSNAIAPAVSA